MKEWKYLLFLAKYHAKRLLKRFFQKGESVFYIGGNDVFPPPLKPEEETVLLERLGGEDDVTVNLFSSSEICGWLFISQENLKIQESMWRILFQ